MAGTRVAVIGAGPFGLAGLKNMREAGFDATGFERRGYVGGIWKHSQDGRISVVPNTVFNGSRSRSAFTDFPFSETVSDYPTCDQLYDYLQDYADAFKLRDHIRLNTSVNTIRRVGGRWELELQTVGNKDVYTEIFDRILVATGSFQTPKYPTIPGIELFDSNHITHSLHYTPSEDYKDKNVLLVGFHATAVDTSESLAKTGSKKVYLSRRNNLLLLKKFDDEGRPFDQTQTMVFCSVIAIFEAVCPRFFYWLLDNFMASQTQKQFPSLKKYNNFLPAPSMQTTTPVAADVIVPYIDNGFVEPIGSIRRVTGPRSVELNDGRVLDDVDRIVSPRFADES
jgi:dimethylaniline monooxygenase (N-oxide forming)